MEKALNTVKKVVRIRFAIGALIIGIVFCGFAAFFILSPDTGNYVKTEGVISDIRMEYIAGENDYVVYVNYTVDGAEYKNVRYDSYNAFMNKGDTVPVEYNVNDPYDIRSDASKIFPYIFLGIGIVVVIIGIVSLVRASKTSVDEMAQYNKVNMRDATPEVVEKIKNDTSPMTNFLFHPGNYRDGTIHSNYAYFLDRAEGENSGEPVIEALFHKTGFLFSKYKIINHLNKITEIYKIGSTTTSRMSGGNGVPFFDYSIVTSSYFKINDIKNWDYIADAGYGFEIVHGTNMIPAFDILHYGVKVGHIELTGLGSITGGTGFISNVPISGLYNVCCRESDALFAFWICFSLANTQQL